VTYWQPFTRDTAAFCVDSPAATTINAILYVACQGGDGALWTSNVPIGAGIPTIPHSSWHSLGGTLAAGPAVVALGGVPTFIEQSTDSYVYVRNEGTAWQSQPWHCLGHPAGALSGSTTYFACQGTDRMLWYATSDGGAWGPPRSLGGILVDGPGVAGTPNGPVFYAEGTDTQVWERGLSSPWTGDGGRVVHGVQAAWIG